MKIILDTTTRKLQILLGGAVTTTELPWTAHYIDITTSSRQTTAWASTNGVTSGSTAVDMVAAPASGVIRVIVDISVYQEDTANALITLRYNDNGTLRKIYKATHAVGDNLIIDGS